MVMHHGVCTVYTVYSVYSVYSVHTAACARPRAAHARGAYGSTAWIHRAGYLCAVSLAAIDQIVKTDTDWLYPPEILIEFTVIKIILFCRCIVLKLFPSIR